MHIVRLWHESPNYQVSVVDPDMFKNRLRRIEELMLEKSRDEKLYYAVKRGWNVGIFVGKKNGEKQIKGYDFAEWRKFGSLQEAADYMEK